MTIVRQLKLECRSGMSSSTFERIGSYLGMVHLYYMSVTVLVIQHMESHHSIDPHRFVYEFVYPHHMKLYNQNNYSNYSKHHRSDKGSMNRMIVFRNLNRYTVNLLLNSFWPGKEILFSQIISNEMISYSLDAVCQYHLYERHK